MGVATIKRQNFICCMEWQRFCPATRFYKADTKTSQMEIERAKRNLFDYQGGKHNEDK